MINKYCLLNEYNIPCDCGRCFIGKRSRPLEIIKEHKYNLTQALLEKLESAQNVYEEGDTICWKEVKVLEIEQNTTYRKYKESAHISLIDPDISTIWIPTITAEVKKLQLHPVKIKWDNLCFLCWYHTENLSLQ
jgi:hypothetical protein